MENNKELMLRKRRVHAQQNFITALCMVCLIFAVGWSIYAIKSGGQEEAAETTVKTVKDESSLESQSESSEAVESEAEEDLSSAQEAVRTDNDYSYAADTQDDLSDAVFIGDSRTVGLMNSTDKPGATFLCAVGLHIDTALTEASVTLDNGNLGTIPQALEQKQYGRVYINFGTNELGWPYIDTFKEYYAELLQTVKELQPDAVIYAEGVLPVTASQDAKGESVNNANAKTFSQAIEEVAAQEGVQYLDCSPAVADENGYLPEDASSDGIHMTSEYCLYWQNFIIDNT